MKVVERRATRMTKGHASVSAALTAIPEAGEAFTTLRFELSCILTENYTSYFRRNTTLKKAADEKSEKPPMHPLKEVTPVIGPYENGNDKEKNNKRNIERPFLRIHYPDRMPDAAFKHEPSCEWPYKYTRAEFEAFHYNKRTWEHKIDYYTIQKDNPYQKYEYLAASLGNAAGIGKLAGFSSQLDVESLDRFEKKLRRPTVCRKTTVENEKRKSIQRSASQNATQSVTESADDVFVQSEKTKMNEIL